LRHSFAAFCRFVFQSGGCRTTLISFQRFRLRPISPFSFVGQVAPQGRLTNHQSLLTIRRVFSLLMAGLLRLAYRGWRFLSLAFDVAVDLREDKYG